MAQVRAQNIGEMEPYEGLLEGWLNRLYISAYFVIFKRCVTELEHVETKSYKIKQIP